MNKYLPSLKRHFSQNKNLNSYLLNRTYSRAVHSESLRDDLPSDAQVVIGGGGLLGCSVAYHLAKCGITDVVVLEKGKVGCGSTWLGSGVVGRLRSSLPEIELVYHSYQLYSDLNRDGYDIGWQATGSLNLCRTPDRLTTYKRNLLLAEPYGVQGEVIDQKKLEHDYPYMKSNDLLGAMHVPGDICIDQMKLLNVLVDIAKSKGVKFVEGCPIRHVHVKSRVVASVETDHGLVKCADFVNCTGQWAREFGKKTEPYGINIPVHASQLSEMLTEPLHELKGVTNMPLVRDYDGFVYFREMNGRILGGGFPPISKPLFHDGIPDNVEFKLLPEDWDNFHVILEQLLHRLPPLSRLKATELRTGYDAFTPDGRPILGIVPELNNYFVAAGFNCAGAAMAGGVGMVLAEWVKERSPRSVNLWPLDVRRFVGLHNNRKFLKERVAESVGVVVAGIPYWEADMIGYDSGRRLRTSAIFTRNEPYAVFGQIMGYERPLFFHTQGSDGLDDDPEAGQNVWTMPKPSSSVHGIHSYQINQSGYPPKGSYGKPPWFDQVKSEYWACREGVCIIDMSTYSKFEMRSAGQEVVKYLQHICSNDIDKPVGSVIHTGMQNEMGGFENDCSVIRLQSNRYFMIGPTVQQTRSFVWMRDHLPRDGSVQLTDITSMYTALNVIGPKAQELLSELTDRSLKKKDFMFMTHKEINLAMASHVRAMRLTHTGEDGWVLYVPSEFGLHVYDALQYNGKNYGLRSAGYYALRILRMEKFFALWGTDLSPLDTPFECGREYRVKLESGGFIGHEALMKQKKEGIKKRLLLLLVDNHDPDRDIWPWAGEPIYRNGKRCGITTSGTYSFGFEKPICYGFIENIDEETNERQTLTNDFLMKNAKYEVNIAGKMFPARAYLYAPVLPSAVPHANINS